MKTNVSSSELDAKLSERELIPDDLMQSQMESYYRDIEWLKTRRAEFVTVSCPACGSQDSSPAFEKFTFQYVKCQRCQTLYITPRPSSTLLAEYYANSENSKFWAKYIFPASEEVRREKVHRPRVERVVGYCDKFGIRRGTLVEIGPGFGTFASLAQKGNQFEQVVAIEPTPDLSKACRARGLNVINKRIEDIQEEIKGADVTVAFETIEHLFEPRLFIQQCARLLKSGGLLVLSCPNGQGFEIAVLKTVSLSVDFVHVNLFNPQSLSLLVEACGFEVLEVSTPGRLDTESVRTAILDGKFDVSDNPFLKRVLVDEWDRLGWHFQEFLAANGLSSHMWLAARKK